MNRLVNLIPKSWELLEKINKHSVIAGGSVAYTLTDWIPLEKVGDIDVFVNNEEDFNTILDLLESSDLSKFDIRSRSVNKYFIFNHELEKNMEENYENPCISVASVHRNGDLVPFQIILSDFQDPMDLLLSFDLDYVQCGFYKGELYQTPESKLAHKSHQVNYFKDLKLASYRLQKAMDKGFKVCWLENNPEKEKEKSKLVPVEIEYIRKCGKKVLGVYLPNIYMKEPNIYMKEPNIYMKEPNIYMKEPNIYMKEPNNKDSQESQSNKKDEYVLSFRDLCIVDWKVKGEKKFSSERKISYGEFILDCLGNEIRREAVSVLVKIEEVNYFDHITDSKGCGALINIKKGYIPSFTKIYKFKVKESLLPQLKELEKKSFPECIICYSMYGYQDPHSRNTKMINAVVHKIFTKEEVQPIKFATDYKRNVKKIFNDFEGKGEIALSIFQQRDPMAQIKSLIKKHNKSKHSMAHAKESAYQCFLYAINEEHKSEKTAIKEACGQMTWDADKQRNNSFLGGGAGFFFSLISHSQETIEEMIHFIEGFN